MPQTEYLVKARSRQGRLVEQKIRGSSEDEVISRVRQLGLTPLAVEPANVGWNREIRLTRGKVKTKDLAIFTRQFATMLASGLPILRCLQILADQSSSARLKDVLGDIRVDVEKGASLSEAMAKRKEFPPLMVSMTRAGEVGGFLDTTMLRIADSLEADVRLRGKIKAALTYPVAVGVIAIVIVIANTMIPTIASMKKSTNAARLGWSSHLIQHRSPGGPRDDADQPVNRGRTLLEPRPRRRRIRSTSGT